MNILEKAYQKHKTWLSICRSFGLDEPTAEDIVMEMYIKIHEMSEIKGKNLWYNEHELNHFYIFKVLYTMFLQLKKKKNRVHFMNEDVLHNVEGSLNPDFKEIEKKFNDEFNKLHWYDQKVFEIIASGTKIAELSRKSQITYISLYNTYTKVKKLLKKKVGL